MTWQTCTITTPTTLHFPVLDLRSTAYHILKAQCLMPVRYRDCDAHEPRRHKAQTVDVGERIAQIVFTPVWHGPIELTTLDEVSKTERGEGNFGSTGQF